MYRYNHYILIHHYNLPPLAAFAISSSGTNIRHLMGRVNPQQYQSQHLKEQSKGYIHINVNIHTLLHLHGGHQHQLHAQAVSPSKNI